MDSDLSLFQVNTERFEPRCGLQHGPQILQNRSKLGDYSPPHFNPLSVDHNVSLVVKPAGIVNRRLSFLFRASAVLSRKLLQAEGIQPHRAFKLHLVTETIEGSRGDCTERVGRVQGSRADTSIKTSRLSMVRDDYWAMTTRCN